MFNWALTFLIIGIIAGVLGLSGIAGTATDIAWTLFLVGLVISLILWITGRKKYKKNIYTISNLKII